MSLGSVELFPSSPPTTSIQMSINSKKRRRSIEPIDDAKVLGLQKLLLPSSPLRTIRDSLCRATKSVDRDVAHATEYASASASANANASVSSAPIAQAESSPIASPLSTDSSVLNKHDNHPACEEQEKIEADRVPIACEVLRRSLVSLSLQLKLKIMVVEAWASDMNSVVIERNLFAIAKELAVLNQLRVFEAETCVAFIDLARERMTKLLVAEARGETIKMDTKQIWIMASMQARDVVGHSSAQTKSVITIQTPTSELEAPLLSTFDASSRDIAVLWNAMSIARERGAQLWHENKPEQALPFLVAADSYMKRFTLKYQRLRIDHAMLAHKQCQDAALETAKRTTKKAATKRVSFAATPQILGTADAEVDRRPISPTKPSKLESLLLRTSREFPTPVFD